MTNRLQLVDDVPRAKAVIYNLKGGLYLAQNMPDQAEDSL